MVPLPRRRLVARIVVSIGRMDAVDATAHGHEVSGRRHNSDRRDAVNRPR
jgi:hypothetical protein